MKNKNIITYGTFDLFHIGHENLLRRAKELGTYLIVGVTSELYDTNRGKLNISQSLSERIENVKNSGFADEIIVEEYEGQKIEDIIKFKADIFAIGSDWAGKFDYLNAYCEVVYLERTKGVSSTELRNKKYPIINIGIIGSGRIANRFIPESKYVSGINVKGVFNPDEGLAKQFCNQHELNFYSNNFNNFIQKMDAVYIASPPLSHANYIRFCLEHGKHVLCEKPMTLSAIESKELFEFAKKQKLVLCEAIKTAYCPAFIQLLTLVKSGTIGIVKDVDASFTKLVQGNIRELDTAQAGGSITEFASYVLLPIIKILGTDFEDIRFYKHEIQNIDYFTKGLLVYKNATASFKVGLGVKTEGNLIISGTKGYVYVPAPWWKTEYFELRFEDLNQTMKYYYKFDSDGLRYEISEFINLINNHSTQKLKLLDSESIAIAEIIEKFRNEKGVINL